MSGPAAASPPFEPLPHPHRCLIDVHARQAKSFQVDETANPFRSGAAIEPGNVAAHAMPDQPGGGIRREQIEQSIKVCDVVGKPIAVGRPGAAPEAAPVKRNQRPIGVKCIDEKLERVARIHEAVQQKHGRPIARGFRTPSGQMDLQSAQDHGLVPSRTPGAVLGQ